MWSKSNFLTVTKKYIKEKKKLTSKKEENGKPSLGIGDIYPDIKKTT